MPQSISFESSNTRCMYVTATVGSPPVGEEILWCVRHACLYAYDLSVHVYISGSTRRNFIKFYLHDTYGHGLVFFP